MKALHVSVHAGDITVWLVEDGHAYPFETAIQAAAAWSARPGYVAAWSSRVVAADVWTADDETFEALRASDDVWWDILPGPLTDAEVTP